MARTDGVNVTRAGGRLVQAQGAIHAGSQDAAERAHRDIAARPPEPAKEATR